MFEFRPPEAINLKLEDVSGNYAAVTSVVVDAKKLLAGRTTLRGDEPVAFSFTVTPLAPATGWQGGWSAVAAGAGHALGNYEAVAVLSFSGGQEVTSCPFRIAA